MPIDPEDGLITDLMLGAMLVFGADIIILAGFAWVAGFISSGLFVGLTVLIVGVFAGWIGWRWWALKQLDPTDRNPLEELKHQYATGELGDREFERKLDRLVETDERVGDERADNETERTLER